MNVGDEFKLGNKNYKVLKIYPKGRAGKDMLLCVNNLGVKECFQEWDIKNYASEVTGLRQYSPKMNEKVREILISYGEKTIPKAERRGLLKRVMQELDLPMVRAQNMIAHQARKLGIKLEKISMATPVDQYDENGKIIRRFATCEEAMIELNIDCHKLRAICTGYAKSPYILKYAKEEYE